MKDLTERELDDLHFCVEAGKEKLSEQCKKIPNGDMFFGDMHHYIKYYDRLDALTDKIRKEKIDRQETPSMF